MSLNHTSKYSELTDEQYQLIGKIMIESANLEFLLKAIWIKIHLLDNMIGRNIVDKMHISLIIEQMTSILDLHKNYFYNKYINDEIISRIKKLIIDIKSNNKRNKFAHWCFYRQNDETLVGFNLMSRLTYKDNKMKEDFFVIFKIDKLCKLHKSLLNFVKNAENILNDLTK